MRWLAMFVLLYGCVSSVPVRFTVPARAATPDAIRAAIENHGEPVVDGDVLYTAWSSVGIVLGGDEGISRRYRIETYGEGSERDIRVVLETRVCDARWPAPTDAELDCRRRLGDEGRVDQMFLVEFSRELRAALLAASSS